MFVDDLQAFRVARNELFSNSRPNISKIAILITDARSDRAPVEAIFEANKTKDTGVEVFCDLCQHHQRRCTYVQFSPSLSHTLKFHVTSVSFTLFSNGRNIAARKL